MNNRILLLLSNLNSQFGNTLLTTQQQGRGELESWRARELCGIWCCGKKESLEKARKAGKPPGKYMMIHSITIK